MIPEVLRIERVFECVLSMVMIAMFLIIVKKYKKNILTLLVFTKASIRRRKKMRKHHYWALCDSLTGWCGVGYYQDRFMFDTYTGFVV